MNTIIFNFNSAFTKKSANVQECQTCTDVSKTFLVIQYQKKWEKGKWSYGFYFIFILLSTSNNFNNICNESCLSVEILNRHNVDLSTVWRIKKNSCMMITSSLVITEFNFSVYVSLIAITKTGQENNIYLLNVCVF